MLKRLVLPSRPHSWSHVRSFSPGSHPKSIISIRSRSQHPYTSIATQQHDKPRIRYVRRRIQTLDPRNITQRDYIDISMMGHPSVKLGEIAERVQIRYHVRHINEPFPPNTSGFLYYRPHTVSEFGGEVRFRLTPVPHPNAFEAGTDLLLPYGLPWRISLLQIACVAKWARLKDSLLADGIISKDVISSCQQTVSKSQLSGRIFGKMRILTSLDDQFEARFDQTRCNIIVLSQGSMHCLKLHAVLREGREYQTSYMYSGAGLFRFERSPSSDCRILHLRLMKIVKATVSLIPDYDQYVPEPREGDLVRVGGGDVWSYDLDKETSRGDNAGFEALWQLPSSNAIGQII